MGVNLTNKAIQDTYEGLVQISGSLLTDGTGSLIPSLDVSASHAVATDATLQEITDNGATTTNPIEIDSTENGKFIIKQNGYNQVRFISNDTLNIIAINTSGSQEARIDFSGIPGEIETTGDLTLDTIGGKVIATDISASGYISASKFIGDLEGNADTAISSSYALTASFAENSTSNTLAEVLTAGNTTLGGQSIIISGSGVISRTFDGDGITSGIAGGEYKIQAGSVDARLVLTGNGDTATNVIKLDNTGVKISGSVGIKDDITLGGDLTGLASNVNVNTITASFASFQSASIGYLQSITGSAKIIGDAFIILNNNTPTERYAGLVVQDSGSTNNTASFEFDGQTNDWFYEYTDDGGATTEHGVALFGAEYSTKGSPSYPANNVLQKGNGGHHLLDSSITDDGTNVSVNANISASGLISASTYYGDGSNLTGISTTPFPFTGSADISGSIDLVGDMIIGTGNTTTLNGKNLIGGNGNTISSTNTNSNVVLGGNSNEITNGGLNIMLGGSDKQITSTGVRNAIINGWGGATDGISAGSNQTIIGGVVSNISATGESNTIVGGRSATISGGANKSVVVGGELNQVSGGERGVVIGGYGNNEQGGNGAIFGGANNSTNTGQFIVVVGGSNNSITGTAENAVIVGGTGGSIVSHNRSVVLGGTSLATSKADEVVVPHLTISGSTIATDISASGYISASSFIGDGSQLTGISTTPFPYTGSAEITGSLGITGSFSIENNTIEGNNIIAGLGTSLGAGEGGVKLGGYNNTNANNGFSQVVIGGRSNNLSAGDSVSIWGGFGNSLSGGEDNAIMAGRSNSINSGEFNTILGGRSNAINSSAFYASIVGGQNNVLSGHQRSVILGGNGLSTTKSDEVVVPSLTTNGAVVQNVESISITSNTGSLDASLGNLFTLTLQNGVDTHLELTNQVAGQTFQLKITNNATSAGTISFDSQFEFEGGTAFTATASTNAVDILTFVCFGGNVQCVGAKNFS